MFSLPFAVTNFDLYRPSRNILLFSYISPRVSRPPKLLPCPPGKRSGHDLPPPPLAVSFLGLQFPEAKVPQAMPNGTSFSSCHCHNSWRRPGLPLSYKHTNLLLPPFSLPRLCFFLPRLYGCGGPRVLPVGVLWVARIPGYRIHCDQLFVQIRRRCYSRPRVALALSSCNPSPSSRLILELLLLLGLDPSLVYLQPPL